MIVLWQCEYCKKYIESQKEKNRIDLVNDLGLKTGRQLWLCKLCTQELQKHERKMLISRIPKRTLDAYRKAGIDIDQIFNFVKEHQENVLDS